MSTVSVEVETPAAATAESPYRMTSDEFFRAVEADVFAPGRRVWLWEGRLYEGMAKKLPHSGASSLLLAAVYRVLPGGWSLWPENPILVDEFSAPLPDLAIVRGTPHDYTRRNAVPRAEEIGLVVEVSDATVRRDLSDRLRVYARAGLPAYWVVNLPARRVETFARPVVEGEASRYEAFESFGPGESVPLVLDGREITRLAVDALLPEAPEPPPTR